MQMYSFSNESNPALINVKKDDYYDKQKGYGWIYWDQDEEVQGDFFKGLGGFLPSQRDATENIADHMNMSVYGTEMSVPGYPLRFKIDVKNKGNYSVTVHIHGGKKGINGLCLYSGRRNLVKRDIYIKANEIYSVTFQAHVGDYIPIMGQPSREDLSIYITLIGQKVRLTEVEVVKSDARTIYIGGDSIVADYPAKYPYNPLVTGGAWGQYLLQYLDRVAVDNQAHGGMTTACFRDDGHLDIVLKAIKPGDVFMFQFGHNDQKRRYLNAFGGYTNNMRWYVQTIRKLGAIPIIVSSLSRIPQEDEKGYYDLLADHAMACRRIGHELDVQVIDLHQYSFELFSGMDKALLQGYFNDVSHTNDYGAMLVADYIAKAIVAQDIQPLAERMYMEVQPLWLPDFSLRPEAATAPSDIEERPILTNDLPTLPYADCIDIPELEDLKKGMALGLLDPCLKYFHPYDGLPRGQFLYMFFKAYKGKCGQLYQGQFCDVSKYEFDASAVQMAWEESLIDTNTVVGSRFRPDDLLTCGELISIVVRSLKDIDDRDVSIEHCEIEARKMDLLWKRYSREDVVSRADCVSVLITMMTK